MKVAAWREVGLLLSAAVAMAVAGCSRPELTSGASLPAGNELYSDGFEVGETGPWLLEGDDSGVSEISDGVMTISIDAPNTLQFVTLKEPSFSDFVAEIDVTQRAGELESSFGLLFRKQEDNRFYRFDITGDGRYMVERRDAEGEWTRLISDWRPSAALATGLDSTNRLRVEALGAEIRVYANGELLEELTDSTLSSGALALDGGTFGRPGLRVDFDNLAIWEP